MADFIYNFGLLFLTVVGVSFLIKLLKQPIILGYVLGGLLFSLYIPLQGFDTSQVMILSELGITFLLFFMGLEFDLSHLKYLGKDILVTSLMQSIIFFAMAFGVSMFFDFTTMERVYLSILFMFSSTLLVAKWVEDKKETSSLHGKIILGTLIMQDVLAILAITLLSLLKEHSWTGMVLAPIKGLVLVIIAFLISRYILNFLLKVSSKYPELLFIFSLGVCFLFAELAHLFGYSTAIGAFIGGVALGNTLYQTDLLNRLKPLVIFFNMLFFVGFGFQIKLDVGYHYITFILLISVLALLVKPPIIFHTLIRRGYDSKTALLSSIYLAQLSEFGIIAIAAGVSAGVIGTDFLSSVAIFAIVITMMVSSYFIKYSKWMLNLFSPLLIKYENTFVPRKFLKKSNAKGDYNAVFFGYNHISRSLISRLQEKGNSILFVERDPEKIDKLHRLDIKHVYGTVRNPEFFNRVDLSKAKIVVSSMTDAQESKIILKHVKAMNPKAVVIVTAKNLKDALDLYRNRADYVIYFSYINEHHISGLLEDYLADPKKILEKKRLNLLRLMEKDADRREYNKRLISRFWNVF